MTKLRKLILDELEKKGVVTTALITRKAKVSRQAVHKHFSALVAQGKVLKQGTSKKTTFYVLNVPKVRKRLWGKIRRFKKRLKAKGLMEDAVYNQMFQQAGFLEGFSQNALEDFHYAFTEMLNNAIDHSQTRFIDIDVSIGEGNVSFWINDTGIGVFENIRQKMKLHDEMESIQDLLKGKQTTMPKRHSGEGIFFTSKIADRFILRSHYKHLIIDNKINDIFIEDVRYRKGTGVFFEISMEIKKDLSDLFNKYTGEHFKFDKSRIEVKLYQDKDSYISRSQAKRLLHTLDRFSEIVLDFKGVPTIGQAFAHEVFCVFKKFHPHINIIPKNCNENVEFMIKRARTEE